MFNELKVKLAYNNVKRNYTKVLEVENIEEVYYSKNKLIMKKLDVQFMTL